MTRVPGNQALGYAVNAINAERVAPVDLPTGALRMGRKAKRSTRAGPAGDRLPPTRMWVTRWQCSQAARARRPKRGRYDAMRRQFVGRGDDGADRRVVGSPLRLPL
jgi:hypothetical protein